MKFRRVEYKKYIKLRIIATLIDYGIYILLFYLYVDLVGTENSDGSKEVNGLPAMLIPLFWFLYFVVLEAVNQATPGHDICKLIVVKSTANKISLGDAFKRRLLDPIDIFLYGIPALICINKTPKFQRLGDLWADTVVIKKTDIIETDVQF
jgi:uncharacterized RDD family membrane protein YckC